MNEHGQFADEPGEFFGFIIAEHETRPQGIHHVGGLRDFEVLEHRQQGDGAVDGGAGLRAGASGRWEWRGPRRRFRRT